MDSDFNMNSATLSGNIFSDPVFSHKSFGEDFYQFHLSIARKSGYLDIIPVIISDRLIAPDSFQKGLPIKVIGQVRTYNEAGESRSHLHVLVFARECVLIEEADLDFENHIFLEGYICKQPQLRTSPLGREICDIMLAVNRMYNKADYIPCIAWGRNARYAGNLVVGTKLNLSGRIQSREYKKKQEDGSVEIKTAYEVSVLNIEE